MLLSWLAGCYRCVLDTLDVRITVLCTHCQTARQNVHYLLTYLCFIYRTTEGQRYYSGIKFENTSQK